MFREPIVLGRLSQLAASARTTKTQARDDNALLVLIFSSKSESPGLTPHAKYTCDVTPKKLSEVFIVLDGRRYVFHQLEI